MQAVKLCCLSGVLLLASAACLGQSLNSRFNEAAPSQSTISLKDALNSLGKAYQVDFLYEDALLQDKTGVGLSSVSNNFYDDLKEVLGDNQLSYEKVGKRTIVITPRESEAAAFLLAGGTIRGKISDDRGQPLPYAQVIIDGTTMGDAADQVGEYSIANVPPGSYTLKTRMIGFRTKTAQVNVAEGETATQDFSLVEDLLEMGEVVVTGTRTPRMKLESTVAISTLSPRKVEQAAPRSTTEVLRYVPGFTRVESSGGEVNQNVSLRGIYGVELINFMEDGLPVFPTMHTFFMNADNLFRVDENIETVEVVRGGNSALFGSNAPAAIVNFINKTGGPTLGGVMKATGGTGALARYDFNVNGPLSESWRFNVGGFYRFDNGVRDPGFPGIRGGQLKGNITRLLSNGYVRTSLKIIDDRNQFVLPLPFQNPDDPEYVEGFSDYGAMNTLEGNGLRIPLPQQNGELTLPLDDGIRTQAYWLTNDISFDFANGWSLQNTAQLMQNDQSWNAILPFDVMQSDDAVRSFLQESFGNQYKGVLQAQGILPQDGQITRNIEGNNKFRIQAPNFTHRLFFTNHFDAQGNKLAFNTENGLLSPGGEWHVEKPISAFQNQLQVKKAFEQHNVTVGAYFANYTQKNRWFFTDILTDVRDNPRFVEMVVDAATLNYSFVSPSTNRDTTVAVNVADLQATNNGFRNFLSNYANGDGQTTVISVFASDEFKLTDRLRVDLGGRFEHNNFVQVSENTTKFDLDGDPLTIFDNETWGNRTFRQYDFSFDEWAVSGGFNYALSDELALFGQGGRGYKMPALDEYLFPAVAQAELFEPRHTLMFEGGVKYAGQQLGFSINGFWGELRDIFTQGAEVDPNTGGTVWVSFESPKTQSAGFEAEVSISPTPGLSLLANGTFVDTKEAGTGADLGSALAGVPDFIGNVSATYAVSGFTFLADWHYVGSRFLESQRRAAAEDKLKAYNYFNLGAAYRIPGQPLTLSANLLNVNQSKGLEEGNPRLRQVGGRTSDLFLARPLLPRRFVASLSYNF